jgi:hypothetical protein
MTSCLPLQDIDSGTSLTHYVKIGVYVDKIDILGLLLPGWLQTQQTTHCLCVNLDPALCRIFHVRQVEPGHNIITLPVALEWDGGEITDEIMKTEVAMATAAEFQFMSKSPAAKKNHFRHNSEERD